MKSNRSESADDVLYRQRQPLERRREKKITQELNYFFSKEKNAKDEETLTSKKEKTQ